MQRLPATMQRLWRGLRTASGDDAYDRYLAHRRSRHAHEGPALTRRAFFVDELKRKWSGTQRCC